MFDENLPNKFTPEQVDKIIKESKVDYHKEIPEPPICLKIEGLPYGTLGNFSVVIGKAKSKKTFLITIALAAAVRNDKVSDIFEGSLPEGKRRVVFIDTEQSKVDVIMTANRVLKQSEIKRPDNFDVYSLRPYNTSEREDIICEIVETTSDLGLLVIDGARDFVTSINDESQATTVSNWLLKITDQRQIHIITVLHQNKADAFARGHLGTELINKAETVISVNADKKESRISKIEPEFNRGIEIEPFAIRINEHGIPEKCSIRIGKGDSKSKNHKLSPNEVNRNLHIDILREVASNLKDKKAKLADVREQIKLSVENHVESIGDSKVRSYHTYYMNQGWIQKNGKDNSPKAFYSIHPPIEKE